MTFTELISKLNSKQNGAFIKIEYTGTLPLNAASKKVIKSASKVSQMTIRKGIEYKNQKAVQEKVADGKVLTHELPWGNWKPGYEGLIIEHKGHDYVRLYPSPNSTKTEYFIDGIKTTYDELKTQNLLVNSFFKNNSKSDCFTINIDNITTIY